MEMVVQRDRGVYAQAAFNYEHLAPEVRTDVQESTRRIHELERRTSESIIEIGQHLIRVKARLPHGEFLPWLDSEFGWSQPTASRFMQVAETFGGETIQFEYFAPSALYALASNKVPDDIREGFQQAAEAGEKVTHSAVKEAITARREEEQRRVMLVDADSGEILDDDETGDYPPYEVVEPGSPEAMFAPMRPAPAPAPTPIKNVHVANNSGENEWYTPAEYIAAAREVMGGIDLDPASSPLANETVQAETFYTKDDNGLSREWYGRVWMNPPYAQPLITYFAEKVADEYQEGNVTEAIVLVNNATETKAWQYMVRAAVSVCFPQGRIRYNDATGTQQNTPLQGQTFLYFGDSPATFREVFARFGVVL